MASLAVASQPTLTQKSNGEYQPALDGIRALAIIAVLLFHGGLAWLPGGFLGVDVFFVLSGYLITGLLIGEYRRSARIGVGAFYLRRLRRLLPALIAMLVICLTCAALFMTDVVVSTARDLPWALTGLSNWWFVIHQQSYFEAMGRPALFQHTWSLAVEFQFYWIWPILLMVLLPVIGELGICWMSLGFGALSVTALMTASSASHAYFGTDTHSLGLFLGAALAAGGSRLFQKAKSGGVFSNLLGIAALAGLVALFQWVGETTDERYRIGLVLAGVSSVVLVAVSGFSEGFVGRMLAAEPLRWLGERSYSIYVWHWPVFQAVRPGIDVTLHGVPNFLLRLMLTVGIAEFSFRYVETPVRRGALGRLPNLWHSWSAARVWVVSLTAAASLLLIVLAETRLVRGAIRADEESLKAAYEIPPPLKQVVKQLPKPTMQADPLALPALLVGDSVLLGVSPLITEQVNVVKVDAVVGRQATEVRERVESMARAGDLPPTVILDLGNNGALDERTLRAILDTLKTRQHVVVVNARVPKIWQDDNDALLARVVPTYPNATLADWCAASDGHPEYFGPDGVHAGKKGAGVYTETVISALRSQQPVTP